MWLVRFITLVLLILPFIVSGGQVLLAALLFFPAMVCAIAVAHQASDQEEDEETDVVSPVFWRALRESGWVFIVLAAVTSSSPHLGPEDGFLNSLGVLAPAAVLALAGCHVGVLFTRDQMSRQASAFGAGAFTTAYLVVAVTGLYYLLYSPYAELVWPLPVAFVLVAGLARIAARMVVGPVKIGSPLPLTIVSAVIAGWTVLVFPLVHNVVQKEDTERLKLCEVNLKNLALALELYAEDSSGNFPPDESSVAGALAPTYLQKMPICPSSGRGYRFELGPDAPSNEAGLEKYYIIICQGHNHAKAECPPNYPRYSIDQGLTVR